MRKNTFKDMLTALVIISMLITNIVMNPCVALSEEIEDADIVEKVEESFENEEENAENTKYQIYDLEWNKYYKYMVKAVDANGNVIKESLGVHFINGEDKEVNTKKITAKNMKLEVGEVDFIDATATPEKKSVVSDDHTDTEFRYYIQDPSIVSINEDEEIKALSVGKTNVYIIAANGVMKKIKVTVIPEDMFWATI